MTNFYPTHFLFQLHNLLSNTHHDEDDVSEEQTKDGHSQRTSIISWSPNGRDFQICDPSRCLELLSNEMGCSTFKSFQLQLRAWGFKRVTITAATTTTTTPTTTTKYQTSLYCYSHPMFQQGRPELCKKLIQDKLKGVARRDKRGFLGLSHQRRHLSKVVCTSRAA